MLQLQLSRNLYEIHAHRGYAAEEKNEGIGEPGGCMAVEAPFTAVPSVTA